MDIILNALQYRINGSGISVTIKELFSRFTNITSYNCKIIVPRNTSAFHCSRNTEIIEAPYSYEEGVKRIFFQSFQMGKRYLKNTIFLTIDSKTPLILPKNCYIIPIITDLALIRMPETYQKSRVLLWRLQYRFLCKHAIFFLAISEFTKYEIMETLHIPEEKIKVIPCAASNNIHRINNEDIVAQLKKKYSLPDQYILFVGNYNPRKNLDRLIHAFDRLKSQTDLPHELVIAGEQGWKFQAEKALQKISYKNAVHFIGYVPDNDMPALYSASSLFVFTTLYEGFGIPVLEAQQCGVPVLTSNLSALPEIAANSALFVNPYDDEEIADGMKKILENHTLHEQLIENGYKNANRYSWDRSAAELEKNLQQIVATLQKK